VSGSFLFNAVSPDSRHIPSCTARFLPAVRAVETPLGNARPLRARAARCPLSLLRRRVTPVLGRHQSLILNLCTTRWILSILVIYWQFCYADGAALTDLICDTARPSGPRRRKIQFQIGANEGRTSRS
jgi:hypothetical protein